MTWFRNEQIYEWIDASKPLVCHFCFIRNCCAFFFCYIELLSSWTFLFIPDAVAEFCWSIKVVHCSFYWQYDIHTVMHALYICGFFHHLFGYPMVGIFCVVSVWIWKVDSGRFRTIVGPFLSNNYLSVGRFSFKLFTSFFHRATISFTMTSFGFRRLFLPWDFSFTKSMP